MIHVKRNRHGDAHFWFAYCVGVGDPDYVPGMVYGDTADAAMQRAWRAWGADVPALVYT